MSVTSQSGGAHVADLLLVELPLLVVQGKCVSSAVVGAAVTNHLLVSSFHEIDAGLVLKEEGDTFKYSS